MRRKEELTWQRVAKLVNGDRTAHRQAASERINKRSSKVDSL